MSFCLRNTLAVPLAFCMLTADVSFAAEPKTMDAETFDAYTRGKTLFYGRSGRALGAETYFDNRRVKWSDLNGQCKEGTWYEEAGMICFVYEDSATPICWAFHEQNGGLTARFENMSGASEVHETSGYGDKMVCLGPEVGV